MLSSEFRTERGRGGGVRKGKHKQGSNARMEASINHNHSRITHQQVRECAEHNEAGMVIGWLLLLDNT